MKWLYIICGLIFWLPSNLPAELLSTPVPWHGKIRNSDFGSILARVQGWSEGQQSGSIHFVAKIPEKLMNQSIGTFIISETPRPTYHQVLNQLFHAVNRNVILEETQQGIKVTYLYTRSIYLSHRVRERLRRTGTLSKAGIWSIMQKRKMKLSQHVQITFLPEMHHLVVKGTRDDLKQTALFFNQN